MGRTTLEKQLGEIRDEESNILKKINERNKKRRIACESCDKSHQIQNLTLIQIYWHIPPNGCIGGDYWNQGEIQFICPETKVINRLSFDNSGISWEERDMHENDVEAQFKNMYGQLFEEVIDGHRYSDLEEVKYMKKGVDADSGEITNGHQTVNHYVDTHRKKFGLVEKKKK